MELVLRDHQVNVVSSLREAMKSQRSVVLYGPTGFGKTECAIHIMQGVISGGRRVAMVMDRIVLCNQTSERLDKYGVPHGVLQSGNKRYRPHEPVQICTVQTLEARESFPAVDLLIVDEAHVHRKSITEFVQAYPRVRVIGLSATPITKGMIGTYEGVVNAVTTEQLVEGKWLVPLRVFAAQQVDMSGARKVAGEWSHKDATARGVVITGHVVDEWKKRTHEFFGKPAKTIVFCAGVAHGEHLARGFEAAGYNFVNISYRDRDDYKDDVIRDFRRPDTEINGIIATDILTKGFDVPDVMIGISARPFSKSLSSHIQQLGRVMRPHPGKDFALWIDHSGNYMRFVADWEEIYEEGVNELNDSKEKAKKEPTEKEKTEHKCPQCGALWAPKSTHCINCGFERVIHNKVQVVEGSLAEVIRAGNRMSQPEKQALLSQLLGYCHKTGKKDGWAYYEYKRIVGKFPGKNLHWIASDVVTQDVLQKIRRIQEERSAAAIVHAQKAPVLPSSETWTSATMQDLYSQLIRYCHDTGKKVGWAYYKFKERTGGLEPRGLSPAPASVVSPALINWITSRNIAWSRSMRGAEQ